MILLVLALTGCLDHTPIPGAEAAFVAMQADFAGYPGWVSVSLDAPSGGTGDDSGHPDGDRVVYVNAVAEDGMAEEAEGAFAVGTVIVKTIAGADIHAMVKRGAGFNTDGAVGWEWFELVLADDGAPVVKWRGEEPPAGETYGSLPGQVEDTGDVVTGDCNACHAGAVDNDFVHTDLAVGLGG